MIPASFARTVRTEADMEIVEYQHPSGVWFSYAVDLLRPDTLQRQRCEEAMKEHLARKYPELLR